MQRISLVFVLLLVVGAVAQTSKTAKTAPKTAQKKSVPATSAKKPEAKSADAAKKATSAAKKTTSAAKKSTTAAKKTTSTAKKTTSTAKKTTKASRKRVVVRKRVQAQPAPERYLEIQEALIARGHAAGPATGVWGNAWADSLKRFQQDQKLEATGKIDALSLIRLGLGPKREVSAAQPAGLEASEPRATAQ